MSTTSADLTTEEKARLVSGQDTFSTTPIPEKDVASVRLSDGPHGLRVQSDGGDNFGLTEAAPATCFPPAVAIGSSWDPDVAARIGTAIGIEARSLGIDIVLGPGVNIKRSPLCGRNFEYLSEDPMVAGLLGSAYVRAVQETGVGTSVKHFAANNQEADRMRVSAEVDARTLREIYFPAFERVVKEARPATVMCAYNKINGTYASQDAWLLTGVLRDEWGFEGLVVSDWGAVHDPVAAVRAGLDLEMPGTKGRTPPIIATAVDSGELDTADLDRSVDRVLALRKWHADATNEADLESHHQLAREVAAECAVLLKNDSVLPLEATQRLAVIGELARTPRYQGGGSSHVNSFRVESFLEAATTVSGAHIVFEPGYVLEGTEAPAGVDPTADLQGAAVAAASAADVAVVFAGLGEVEESEGFDRATLELPQSQVALIKAIAAAAPRTVVVLSHGGVVTMEEWHDDVDAILEGFLLGQAGGAATADLLFGVVNPSGRLAETIPRKLADHPSSQNFPGERGQVIYGERLLVGYRAFTSLDITPRYAFGHGLSYTTFETSDFQVVVTGPDSATARMTVTNTGERDGAHVVQLYVAAGGLGGVQRPRRELRAFTKVHLRAGESSTVELTLDRRAFAFWEVELDDWSVEAGTYVVELCTDAHHVEQEREIMLTGDGRIRELTLWSTLQEWVDHPVVGPSLADEIDIPDFRFVTAPRALLLTGTLPMQKIVNVLKDAVPPEKFEELMARTRQ